MDKKKKVLVLAGIIAIILIVSFSVGLKIKGNKKDNIKEESQIQPENNTNSKLAQIQSKIDEQQKVIDDINNQMTPLLEERAKLEEQLISLTTESNENVQETQDTVENTEE